MEVVTVAALVTLAILASWYSLDRRTRRRALAQRFDHTSRQLDELTVPLTTVLDSLNRQIELVRGAYAADELPHVLGTSAESLRAGNSLLVRRSNLPAIRDEVADGQDLNDLSRSIRALRRLEALVRGALPTLHAEEERLTRAITCSVDVENRLREVASLADRLRSAVDAATRQGFHVPHAASLLARLPGRVEEIQRLVATRHLLAAQDPLDGVVADLTTAIDELGQLPHREQLMGSRLEDLAEALREIDDLSELAAAARAELETHYADSVSHGLDRDPTAASDHVRRAAERLARAQSSLDDGDLDRAERLWDAATTSYVSARTQLQQPLDRLATVRELRGRLPGRKAELYERAVALEKRVEGEPATESFTGLAREIRSQLERVDLTSRWPDWLDCERRIGEIESLIDRGDAGVGHCLTTVNQLRGERRSLTRRLREERSARYEAEGTRRWWSEAAF